MQTNLRYGQLGMDNLAKYPDRYMRAQRLQDAIPIIKELDFDRTDDLRRKMQIYSRELKAYAIATQTVIATYQRIIDDATRDSTKLNSLADNAPEDVNETRKEMLYTSVIIAQQLIASIQAQQTALRMQLDTVKTSQEAIGVALNQLNVAQIIQLHRELTERDAQIHNRDGRP